VNQPTQHFGERFGVIDVAGATTSSSILRKRIPFVLGGYILFFRSGTASLFVGAFHYWTSDKYGVRFEFIDRIWSDFGAYHYYSFLVGFTIR
jgi:hypothetical protein